MTLVIPENYRFFFGRCVSTIFIHRVNSSELVSVKINLIEEWKKRI